MHETLTPGNHPPNRPRILVVEDGETARQLVVRGLREEGCEVIEAADGMSGLEAACRDKPDLILLDLLLPRLDGEHLLEKLRTTSDVPVIVTSVRGSEDDRVEMLNLGADDYVVKPFAVRELLARIRAVLRRRSGAVTTTVTVGGVTVDFAARRALVLGEPVALTPLEFAVLACLVRKIGRVVSRADLEAVVAGNRSGTGGEPASNVVDVIMLRLRKKLGRNLIGTRRSQGFIIEDDSLQPPPERPLNER